jgi:hypothetical protein
LIDYDTAALPTGDWLGSESPWVTMEPSLWAASASEMPDAKRQEIGARMTRLVEISLPMALYHAGLAPEPHADADSVREMLLGHEPVPYFNASSQ